MSTWPNLSAKTGDPTNMLGSIVLDASVAIKWFYSEADSDKALELLDKIHLGKIQALVPDLIVYEICNALWKGKKAPKARILDALDDLNDSGLQMLRLKEEVTMLSIEIMTKYDLSFYDSVYAGLAALLDTPLLTANPKDHKKVKEINVLSLSLF